MYPDEDKNVPERVNLDQGLLEYLEHPAYENFFREFQSAKYKYPQRAAVRACVALDKFLHEDGEGGGIPWDKIPEAYICLAFDAIRPTTDDDDIGHFSCFAATVPLRNCKSEESEFADWLPSREIAEYERPAWNSLRDVIGVCEPELFDMFPQWYLELHPSQSLVFRPGYVIPVESDDSKKE